MAKFYVGKRVRGKVRVTSVDPQTGKHLPEEGATDLTIRFKNPDGSVLSEQVVGSDPGVIEAGNGYYYASAVPEVPGLHTIEFEKGSGDAFDGLEKITFTVQPF